ncbi:hypothetical protein NDU88_001757 [Pleurodeles waltl]|uniref:Uncharacterized protein n=1 Tax=Pleurodeles waltl TaxID=8319 RepID=A0AAV7U9C3_PLEWA|nr:hypothetical protein NDU88_001757 [Pleurodeles waltl]
MGGTDSCFPSPQQQFIMQPQSSAVTHQSFLSYPETCTTGAPQLRQQSHVTSTVMPACQMRAPQRAQTLPQQDMIYRATYLHPTQGVACPLPVSTPVEAACTVTPQTQQGATCRVPIQPKIVVCPAPPATDGCSRPKLPPPIQSHRISPTPPAGCVRPVPAPRQTLLSQVETVHRSALPPQMEAPQKITFKLKSKSPCNDFVWPKLEYNPRIALASFTEHVQKVTPKKPTDPCQSVYQKTQTAMLKSFSADLQTEWVPYRLPTKLAQAMCEKAQLQQNCPLEPQGGQGQGAYCELPTDVFQNDDSQTLNNQTCQPETEVAHRVTVYPESETIQRFKLYRDTDPFEKAAPCTGKEASFEPQLTYRMEAESAPAAFPQETEGKCGPVTGSEESGAIRKTQRPAGQPFSYYSVTNTMGTPPLNQMETQQQVKTCSRTETERTSAFLPHRQAEACQEMTYARDSKRPCRGSPPHHLDANQQAPFFAGTGRRARVLSQDQPEGQKVSYFTDIKMNCRTLLPPPQVGEGQRVMYCSDPERTGMAMPMPHHQKEECQQPIPYYRENERSNTANNPYYREPQMTSRAAASHPNPDLEMACKISPHHNPGEGQEIPYYSDVDMTCRVLPYQQNEGYQNVPHDTQPETSYRASPYSQNIGATEQDIETGRKHLRSTQTALEQKVPHSTENERVRMVPNHNQMEVRQKIPCDRNAEAIYWNPRHPQAGQQTQKNMGAERACERLPYYSNEEEQKTEVYRPPLYHQNRVGQSLPRYPESERTCGASSNPQYEASVNYSETAKKRPQMYEEQHMPSYTYTNRTSQAPPHYQREDAQQPPYCIETDRVYKAPSPKQREERQKSPQHPEMSRTLKAPGQLHTRDTIRSMNSADIERKRKAPSHHRMKEGPKILYYTDTERTCKAPSLNQGEAAQQISFYTETERLQRDPQLAQRTVDQQSPSRAEAKKSDRASQNNQAKSNKQKPPYKETESIYKALFQQQTEEVEQTPYCTQAEGVDTSSQYPQANTDQQSASHKEPEQHTQPNDQQITTSQYHLANADSQIPFYSEPQNLDRALQHHQGKSDHQAPCYREPEGSTTTPQQHQSKADQQIPCYIETESIYKALHYYHQGEADQQIPNYRQPERSKASPPPQQTTMTPQIPCTERKGTHKDSSEMPYYADTELLEKEALSLAYETTQMDLFPDSEDLQGNSLTLDPESWFHSHPVSGKNCSRASSSSALSETTIEKWAMPEVYGDKDFASDFTKEREEEGVTTPNIDMLNSLSEWEAPNTSTFFVGMLYVNKWTI